MWLITKQRAWLGAGSIVRQPPSSLLQSSLRACLLNSVCLSGSPWTLPARFLWPWDFPGKNTGVGYHALLQGIFPTQGSNLSLLLFINWQMDSLRLGPPGNVCVWLNFFAVYLKLSHCLLISYTSIQNKKLKKNLIDVHYL